MNQCSILAMSAGNIYTQSGWGEVGENNSAVSGRGKRAKINSLRGRSENPHIGKQVQQNATGAITLNKQNLALE